MITQSYSKYSSNITSINLLDFRRDLGNVLDKNREPLEIRKRGKAIGIMLPIETGRDFLEWKKRNDLRQCYLAQKDELKKLGKNVLIKSKLIDSSVNLDSLSADQITQLVSQI
jgi:hypothetical protein